MDYRLLSLSGGATRFAGLLAGAKGVIDAGYKPNALAGVSAGAIAMLPLVLGLSEPALKIATNIKLKDIFSSVPVKSNGKLTWTAIFRALIGKKSLGKLKIQDLFSTMVNKDLFEKYKQGYYPDCYCVAVEMSSGARQIFNLKELCYLDALDCIAASAAVPLASEAIQIGDKFYFDGGLRDHNPSRLIAEYLGNVSEIVSIYARSKDLTGENTAWKKGLLPTLFRMIDVFNFEISKSDELMEMDYCRLNGIYNVQLFLPSILQSLFDTDPNRLKQYADIAYQIGKNYNNGKM